MGSEELFEDHSGLGNRLAVAVVAEGSSGPELGCRELRRFYREFHRY